MTFCFADALHLASCTVLMPPTHCRPRPQASDSSVGPPAQHSSGEPHGEPWGPPVDLGHLSEGQQQPVKQMLREECDVFAKDDWDTGCIKDLEMDIQLTDKLPVQRTFNAIPTVNTSFKK